MKWCKAGLDYIKLELIDKLTTTAVTLASNKYFMFLYPIVSVPN